MKRRTLHLFCISLIPVMMCSSIRWTTSTLFIADLGGTKTQIGLIYMVSTAVGIIFGPEIGRLSDKVGRRPILFLSMVCFTLYFILSFFARSSIEMFPITLLEGIGYITLGTAAPALVADIVTVNERGWAMGIYNRVQNAGWLMGYGLGGYLADAVGFKSTFLVSTGLMIFGILITSLLPTNKTLDH